MPRPSIIPATDMNFKEMSNLGIDALASHYHRYTKWIVKTGVSNVHGDIRTFYSGMLTKDNVDKVEQTYINNYQNKKQFISFLFHARPSKVWKSLTSIPNRGSRLPRMVLSGVTWSQTRLSTSLQSGIKRKRKNNASVTSRKPQKLPLPFLLPTLLTKPL